MPLTRSFKELVQRHVAEDPAYAEALLHEDQFKSLQSAFPGIDIEEMERQFIVWNEGRGVTPDNFVSALYGFIRNKLRHEAGG
jgi:hypothetical protein